MKRKARRPIRRNPDIEAQRSWESDRSDRQALQRYLSSMARDREVLDDPERIVDLDEAVGDNEALRQIYARVRPDYSNAATPFREERWRTLVDRYAGQNIDPRAVLTLVEMGLRSGVPINDVYRILYERTLISNTLYQRILAILNENVEFSISRNFIEIPALIQCLQSESERTRNDSAAILGSFGPVASSAVPSLTRNIITNRYNSNVVTSIRSLGEIGPRSSRSVPYLVDLLRDSNDLIRETCAISLSQIGENLDSAIPTLISRIENDDYRNVRSSCIDALVVALSKNANAQNIISDITNKFKYSHIANARYSFAMALGQIGKESMLGKKALSIIEDLFYSFDHSDDINIKSACVYSLAEIARGSLNDSDISEFNKKYISNKVVDYLCKVMKDDDDIIRVSCAIGLGKIGPAARSAIPYIKNEMKTVSKRSYYHEVLRKSLSEIKGEDTE